MSRDDTAVAAEPRRARAVALPPSERRAELVAATLPLVLEHGTAVTTRQIAEAAGVAEGTIFRAFADKNALIDAVVEAAADPAPSEAALRAIDPVLPLEERLVQAVEILRRRIAHVFQVMAAVGPPTATSRVTKHRGPELTVLATLFESDVGQLRRNADQAAAVLRGLTLAGTHPLLILDEPLSSEEIVSLVLDGIRARPVDPSPSPEPR